MLPRFAMFQLLPPGSPAAAGLPPPTGVLAFSLPERASRVAAWLARSFPARPEHMPVGAGGPGAPALDVRFLNSRNGGLLRIAVAEEAGGPVRIATDDMELAGDVLSDMVRARRGRAEQQPPAPRGLPALPLPPAQQAAHLNVHELESTADFPAAMASFRHTLSRLDECNAIRNKLSGEMAQSAAAVKGLVIRAEDARLRADMAGMRRAYAELRALNGACEGRRWRMGRGRVVEPPRPQASFSASTSSGRITTRRSSLRSRRSTS